MSDGRVVIEVDLDTDKASRNFSRFTDSLRDAAGGFRAIGMLMGSSLTAPIIAASTVAVGALGASFITAGAHVAAFAAIAIPALSGVFEASEKIEKINERIAKADTTKERAAAMKELQMVMGELSTKEREALTAWQQFGTFWDGFVAKFQEPILDLFIASLKTLQTLITQLEPLFKASIGSIEGLFNRINASVESGALKPWIEWMASTGGSSLSSFAKIAGNTLEGVMNLLKAFSPLSSGVENRLVALTEKFVQWSAGLEKSKAFQQFIDYAKANAPAVLSVIGQLGTLFVNLAAAIAPLGSVLLQVFNYILQGVNWFLQLHPAIGQTIVWMTALGLALLKVIPAVTAVWGWFGKLPELFTKIGTFFARIGTQIAAFVGRIVGFLPRIVSFFTGFMNILRIVMTFLFTNPFGLLIVAITALVAAGIWLYNNWDQVKAWLLQIWSSIKSAGLEAWQSLKTAVVNAAKDLYNGAKSAINSLKSFVSSSWSSIKSGASSAWSTIKNTVVNAAKSLYSSALSTFRSLQASVSSIWSSIRSAASSAWSSIKSTISNGIRSAYNTIRGYVSQFKSAGKALLDALASGISNGISKAVGAVKNGMAKIRSYLPFSPAKEGALSDLDKSGESFFPTFASKMDRGLRPAVAAVDTGLSELKAKLNHGTIAPVPSAGNYAPQVVINNPTVRSDDDLRKITEQFSEIMYRMGIRRQRFL